MVAIKLKQSDDPIYRSVNLKAVIEYRNTLTLDDVYEAVVDWCYDDDFDSSKKPTNTEELIAFLDKAGCFEVGTNSHSYFMEWFWDSSHIEVKGIDVELND